MTLSILELAVGLLIVVLALAQEGCWYERKDIYSIEEIHPLRRARMEQKKRDLVKIEDLKVGNGPLAAWGRKISAHLRVDQADGTFIFEGPVFDLIGFKGFPESSRSSDEHLLMGFNNPGIRLGLNGMAVGGKRRITVDRKLVCENIKEDDPNLGKCHLVDRAEVLKQKLIIEATLTESCIPVRLEPHTGSAYMIKFFLTMFGVKDEIYCRTLDEPKPNLALPIWHFY